MSKLYCATCKYYDFNTCEGVDWCRLNDEETGICGHCERDFEDLEEVIEHYDAIVEENNKLYSLNCEMASKVADLEHRLSNCIEPKFKKGDLVFANTIAYWESEKPIRHTTEQEIEEIVYFYKLKNYDLKNWEIDEVFSTYNEAKAKLNEIQGDKR